MSHLDSSHRNPPQTPQDGADAALFGFGGLAVLIYLIGSGTAVFAASLTAGVAVVVVIAAAVVLSIPVYRKHGWKSPPFVLLIVTALCGALGGIIVFKHHCLAFTPAAWVLNGLYIAALVSGAWSAVSTWLKALAALLAVSLVTATVVLPRPPGGDGPLDTAKQWSVDVEVVDENDQPLEGALVMCNAVLSWKTDMGLSETFARQTDQGGRIPTWEFDEDPRLKVVICNVWKNADDGNAGYPAETQFLLSPVGGSEYELHFKLTENPHPDVSFLTLKLSGNYEQAWYTLQFELWSGTPDGYFGSRDGPQPVERKSWSDLRGNGFTIPAQEESQDLQLRYFYEGPGGEGLVPPHSEIQTIALGSIPAGTRKQLDLTIPARLNNE